MTPPTPKLAAGAIARAETGDPAAPAADAGPFVLNLCSSTTPMALAQTDLPELKRFTFFVSRRFEEGRERFRLHMGYFATLAEAEEWLGVVREIYPGAWAGEAPGKKLRARAAAAAAAQAQHAVGPQPSAAAVAADAASPARSSPVVPRPAPPAANAPIMTTAKPPATAPSIAAVPPAVIPVPGSPAATAAAMAAPAALPGPAASQARAASPGAAGVPAISVPTLRAAAPPHTNSISTGAPALGPVAKPAPVQVAARAKNAPAAPAATAHSAAPQRATNASNGAGPANTARVASGGAASIQARASTQPGARPNGPGVQRGGSAAQPAGGPATIAPAGASGANGVGRSGAPAAAATAAQMGHGARRPAPGASRTSASGKYPRPVFEDSNVREVLKSLDEDTGETGETRMMPAPAIPRVEAADDSSLTDTQVLRFLESRREGTERSNDVGDTGIALLKPDDTGTRRALKEAVTQNAPVSFAVQLQWSVQPVELDKVPPLAIFSAYTLYTVEGSRDGRKWYGLRLGFFSDAISAKQVAYYVRSEFASVAVVPVSPHERTRATEEDKKAATLAFPKKVRSEPIEEFKLIDPDEERANEAAARSTQRSVASKPAGAAKPVPAQPAVQPGAAAKRNAAKGGGGRVGAREKRGPQTLEETLEILGASELEIDSGRGESLNDTGVRHLRVQVQKNTPFSRLLERLSERIKKP